MEMDDETEARIVEKVEYIGEAMTVLSTAKLSSLGWDPMTPRSAIERAVEGPVDPERDPGPDSAAVDEVLSSLSE